MFVLNETEAYSLYCRAGVESGTPLPKRDFVEFWRSLTDEERGYWVNQFERGPTRLTLEFVGDIDATELSLADIERMSRASVGG